MNTSLKQIYQALFEKHLKEQFPSWEAGSPFDPMRQFVKAISQSFSEIERRQTQSLDRVLDNLPTLFGFEPKVGALPRGLFTAEPTPTLQASMTLPAGTYFSFQKDEQVLFARTLEEAELVPANPLPLLCEFGELRSNWTVAELRGEPWEALALPVDLLQVPATLELHFPFGEPKLLHRREGDLLSVHNANPELFADGFFYDGVHHAVVLPEAHRLVAEFQGGVSVVVPQATFLPPFAWIPEGFIGSVPSLSAAIDTISATRAVSPALERESTASYLARFYSTLRLLHPAEKKALCLEDVRTALLNRMSTLRDARLELNRETGLVTIALAPERELTSPDPLPRSLHREATEILSSLLPLSLNWRLVPLYAHSEESERRTGHGSVAASL